MSIIFHIVHDIWLQMTIKYKELELLAKSETTKWVKEGASNLFAVARGNGSVFWIVRASYQKRRSVITLGRWPAMKAETARELAPSVKILIRQGFSDDAIKNALEQTSDPRKLLFLVEGRRVSQESRTPSFETVARDWYENHLKDGLSEGTYKRQVIQQLNDHIFPLLGDRPIDQIRRRELVNCLREVWLNKKPTGSKLRGNIERIFDFAIDNEWCENNPAPPARSMPKSKHQVQHFKSLAYERIPELWTWIHERPRMGPQTQVGLALAILLGKRTSEIRKMRWSDIDFEKDIWITPAEDMKKRKAHRQPLSIQAVERLEYIHQLTSDQTFVLANSNDKIMSENAMLYALKRFGDFTTHGLRASLGSWCSENGVSKAVSDHIKAHQPKYLDAAYDRVDLLEERRAVLQDWADYVTGGVGEK